MHALLRFPFGGSLAPPGQEALGTPREFLVLSRNGRASGNPSPGVVFSLPVCGLVERSTALIPRRPWRPVRARSLSAVLGLTLFLAGLLGSRVHRIRENLQQLFAPARIFPSSANGAPLELLPSRPPSLANRSRTISLLAHVLLISGMLFLHLQWGATESRQSRAGGSTSRATHFLSRSGPKPLRSAIYWNQERGR